MAQPTDFPESNATFVKPPGVADEDCGPLKLMKTDARLISCWKLTPEELAEVQRTGVVWLSVYGNGTPPVLIEGHNPCESFSTFSLPVIEAKPKGDDDGKTED